MSRGSSIGSLLLLHRLIRSPTPHLRSFQTLAFEEIQSTPENTPRKLLTAFILHGLLGSGRNWRSFARSLASSLSPSSQWRFVLVDLRNHGNSAEIPNLLLPHNLQNASNDLADLVKSKGWNWPDVVMGHSMGGKVAMQFAQSCADGSYGDLVSLPKQIWVFDSVPGKVLQKQNGDDEGEVEKVLKTLQSLPSSTIPSRKWLVDHMLDLGFSRSLSEWIGSNLKSSGGGGLTWGFNLDGAVQMFESYREMDYWPLLEHPPKDMEISLVRAEKSDRWDPDDIRRLECIPDKPTDEMEGKISIHVLPNAGHWVHVDNPKGLLDIVSPRVASLV